MENPFDHGLLGIVKSDHLHSNQLYYFLVMDLRELFSFCISSFLIHKMHTNNSYLKGLL